MKKKINIFIRQKAAEKFLLIQRVVVRALWRRPSLPPKVTGLTHSSWLWSSANHCRTHWMTTCIFFLCSISCCCRAMLRARHVPTSPWMGNLMQSIFHFHFGKCNKTALISLVDIYVRGPSVRVSGVCMCSWFRRHSPMPLAITIKADNDASNMYLSVHVWVCVCACGTHHGNPRFAFSCSMELFRRASVRVCECVVELFVSLSAFSLLSAVRNTSIINMLRFAQEVGIVEWNHVKLTFIQ